jgi:hypothetical protein
MSPPGLRHPPALSEYTDVAGSQRIGRGGRASGREGSRRAAEEVKKWRIGGRGSGMWREGEVEDIQLVTISLAATAGEAGPASFRKHKSHTAMRLGNIQIGAVVPLGDGPPLRRRCCQVSLTATRVTLRPTILSRHKPGGSPKRPLGHSLLRTPFLDARGCTTTLHTTYGRQGRRRRPELCALGLAVLELLEVLSALRGMTGRKD